MSEITAKKSYKDGHVSVRVILNSSGWKSDSVKIQGATDLSCTEARELAHSLIAEADKADAKMAAKAASEKRRKDWRDREIAAGRMKVINLA